jgi:DNA repair exonuclease SbcCD ATPase subunit
MAKKLYWLGKGQVKVDGKLYGKDSGHGRAFPVNKVDADRLASWKKDGLVSDKPFEDDDSLTTIEALNAKIKDLSTQIVEQNKVVDEATKPLNDEIKELTKQVKELESAAEGECEDCVELQRQARIFYDADGEEVEYDTVEEVVELRKQAAVKMAELEKQVEDLTNPDKSKDKD